MQDKVEIVRNIINLYDYRDLIFLFYLSDYTTTYLEILVTRFSPFHPMVQAVQLTVIN